MSAGQTRGSLLFPIRGPLAEVRPGDFETPHPVQKLNEREERDGRRVLRGRELAAVAS
jgi:hypothetical protein